MLVLYPPMFASASVGLKPYLHILTCPSASISHPVLDKYRAARPSPPTATTSMILRTWATRGKPCFVAQNSLGLRLRPPYTSARLGDVSTARQGVAFAYSTSAKRLGQDGPTGGPHSTSPAHPASSLKTRAPVDAPASTGTSQQPSTAAPAGPEQQKPENDKPTALRENIYTLPNLLTVSRIVSCPFLGYFIVNGNFVAATSLLFYAGVSDLLDGWLARKYNMGSVFGSILDPAADKALMTTLTIALAVKGLLPVPLSVLILGRDVALSISAFYFRYISLPEPKTFQRYWDFSIPSAEVKPTQISKYNTFLQLVLMGVTTVSPLVPLNMAYTLKTLQVVVAGTTIWSGLSYVGGRQGLKILTQTKDALKKP